MFFPEMKGSRCINGVSLFASFCGMLLDPVVNLKHLLESANRGGLNRWMLRKQMVVHLLFVFSKFGMSAAEHFFKYSRDLFP